MPTNNKALIIFTRNPELGKVKTRLAKTIGNEKALAIYKDLLLHTQKVVKDIKCDRFVFYSEHIITDDSWEEDFFEKHLQQGTDLGERMKHAFETVFGLGYERVIIVGSDIFDLQAKHINLAFEALNTYDFVIGPAEDGGYYLFGMKKLLDKVFENKVWGTETVFESTLNDLEKHTVFQLETLNDIDTEEDLLRSGYRFKP